VHQSGSYVELNAIAVLDTTPAESLGVGTYDDRDTRIIKSPGWTQSNYTGMYNDTFQYSTVVNSSISLAFTGGKVEYIFHKDFNLGIAYIYVDGELVDTVNQYHSSLILQQNWVSEAFSSGTHIMNIVHSSGGVITFESLRILEAPTPTPTYTQTFSPSPTFTNTPIISSTPIPTRTSTSTFTASPTLSVTPTITPTPIPSEPAPQGLLSAQYLYDGDGTMVRGIVNGTITFYPGRYYNKEVTAGSTKIQKFYFAGTMTTCTATGAACCMCRDKDPGERHGRAKLGAG
jgi:hypothetical protein